MTMDPQAKQLIRQASELCSESERPKLEIQYIDLCWQRDIALDRWVHFDGNPMEERRLYGVYQQLFDQTFDLEKRLGLPQ